jgi:hypothetical protein
VVLVMVVVVVVILDMVMVLVVVVVVGCCEGWGEGEGRTHSGRLWRSRMATHSSVGYVVLCVMCYGVRV